MFISVCLCGCLCEMSDPRNCSCKQLFAAVHAGAGLEPGSSGGAAPQHPALQLLVLRLSYLTVTQLPQPLAILLPQPPMCYVLSTVCKALSLTPAPQNTKEQTGCGVTLLSPRHSGIMGQLYWKSLCKNNKTKGQHDQQWTPTVPAPVAGLHS